jgi:hypothetical protein
MRSAAAPTSDVCVFTFEPHAGKHALGWRSPAVCRSKVRPTTSVARGADVPVCLGRSGGRLAGGRLGQRFHQRSDLGIGVASVAAQGTEVGQPALLCPAAHRLWRHMEELGDLRCTEVPRLSWRWHQCAPFWPVSPMWGTTLRSSGANAIQRSTQRASRGVTACEGLDNDARAMSAGVFARLEVHHRAGQGARDTIDGLDP